MCISICFLQPNIFIISTYYRELMLLYNPHKETTTATESDSKPVSGSVTKMKQCWGWIEGLWKICSLEVRRTRFTLLRHSHIIISNNQITSLLCILVINTRLVFHSRAYKRNAHSNAVPCSSCNLEYYLKMSVPSLMTIHPIVVEGKVRNSAKVTKKYNLGTINVCARTCANASNRRWDVSTNHLNNKSRDYQSH